MNDARHVAYGIPAKQRRQSMTVLDIVKYWLESNGYDGLYTDACGCELKDLAPCGGEGIADCEAGYKNPCPGQGKCEFYDPKVPHSHIERKKLKGAKS
jgi:hypothetical protein